MKEIAVSRMTSNISHGASSPMSHLLGYSSRLLRNLATLRTSATSLCDVELVPGLSDQDNVVYEPQFAHRIVLAAASPYFNAMFTNDLVEARRPQIYLQNINGRTLKSLLHFVYFGEICLNQDNVQEILIASDMIELQEVVEMCTEYLVGQLDASNAIGIYRFASDHNCLLLKNAAFAFICQNFWDVCHEEEFRDIPKEILNFFLSNESLQIDSEYQVFVAAMTWIMADVVNRRRHIFEIFKWIRLPLVPSKRLESFTLECSDISLKVALESIRKDLAMRKGGLVSPFAQPRLGAKKFIYVIGGSHRELGSAWNHSEYTFDSVEMFDIYNKRWLQKARMHTGRILPGIAIVHGQVFVAGGECGSEILATGEVYDPHEDRWSQIAPMTVPRCEFGMCSLDGYIYAFGGWVGEDIGGSIERYDPECNQWNLVSKMPEPRFSMGICAYNGVIYLVGGCTHSRRHMQELVGFDPISGKWNSFASMVVPRSQVGCIVLDDCLYVIGGTNRRNEVLQSVERYHFKENRWEEIPPMLQPRASPAVATVNGKIYVFGGDQINEVNFYRARMTIAAAEIFDPLTNKWTLSEDLPQSRSEAGAVVI